MNIAVAHRITTTEAAQDCCSAIHRFISAHRDALRNAARLLGGYDATHLVDSIVDALDREYQPSRRTVGLLHDLEDLLALENVGDPDLAESGYFAVINPSDPVVEEICLLTDQFREAFHALPEHPDLGKGVGNQDRTLRPPQALLQKASAVIFPLETKGDAQ